MQVMSSLHQHLLSEQQALGMNLGNAKYLVQGNRWEAQPPVSLSSLAVRQSLTALCGGEAAGLDWLIDPQVKAA
jgi:hypothetical protein